MFLSGVSSPFYTDVGRLLPDSAELCVIRYFFISTRVIGLPNTYGKKYFTLKKVRKDSPGWFCLGERKNMNRVNKALENTFSHL